MKIGTDGWTISDDLKNSISKLPFVNVNPRLGGIGPIVNPGINWEAQKKAIHELLFQQDVIKKLKDGLSSVEANVKRLADEPIIRINDVDLGSDDVHISIHLNLNKDLTSHDARDLIFMQHISEGQDLTNVNFFKLDSNKNLTSGEHIVELTRTELILDRNTLNSVYGIMNNSRPRGIYVIDPNKGLLDFH